MAIVRGNGRLEPARGPWPAGDLLGAGPGEPAARHLYRTEDMPTRLLRWAAGLLSPQRGEWGQAMLGELDHLDAGAGGGGSPPAA